MSKWLVATINLDHDIYNYFMEFDYDYPTKEDLNRFIDNDEAIIFMQKLSGGYNHLGE